MGRQMTSARMCCGMSLPLQARASQPKGEAQLIPSAAQSFPFVIESVAKNWARSPDRK